MKRSASEVIRNLEMRVARLENRTSGFKEARLVVKNSPKMFWDVRQPLHFEHEISSSAVSHLEKLALNAMKRNFAPYEVLDLGVATNVAGSFTNDDEEVDIFFKVKYIREARVDKFTVGLTTKEVERILPLHIPIALWKKCKKDPSLCILKSKARNLS